MPISIQKATPTDYPKLTEIWERSVRATHHFLQEEDLAEIKTALPTAYFPNVDVWIIVENDIYIGFIGIAESTIEMLFIDSHYQALGYGSKLIAFALVHGATKVDVNEQNIQAFAFYRNKGFRVIGRDETDSAGKAYPILHMKL
ncbi:MAG: GNAT family N-acetyltransferase [Paludibacter sp.]|nr:GNAT family N-acetyltransferase [Bacteroidales bacterium]MCM1069488.1 GNAT family N-acetyltransferase [Prevotella sp.]MCM1354144.1 GNAT family N-acetyltransferase [Bacteroides sp.]MCM1442999.1 GNAT family N-acetyltransferase [Muribaculum sp.]MCM1482219.1 GNAT family N-acetyltransferase [Paludibacter sp.]